MWIKQSVSLITRRMRLRSKSIILIMLLPVFLKAQLIPISSARLQPLGSTVTVRGVVTNGAELGKIRYFQDGTGGMAAYPGSGSAGGFEGSVTRGDSVEITGTLVDYHGLLEISPILSYAVIQSGLPGPTPIGLDITQISEAYSSWFPLNVFLSPEQVANSPQEMSM